LNQVTLLAGDEEVVLGGYGEVTRPSSNLKRTGLLQFIVFDIEYHNFIISSKPQKYLIVEVLDFRQIVDLIK